MSAAPEKNWLVALRIAETKIGGARLMGLKTTDENIYRDEGFSDAAHFWSVALAEPRSADGFVRLLADYFFDPQLSPQHDLTAMGVRRALKLALAVQEPWIYRDSNPLPQEGEEALNRVFVRPADAVRWMLTMPTTWHLLPKGLRGYFEKGSDEKPIGSFLSTPKKRGRKPDKFERIFDAMIADLREGRLSKGELNDMLEKTLAPRYGAARETVRKARSAVLSVFVED